MVRTRRMAAMTGDENNGEESSNPNPNDSPQPMAIDEKPAKKKKAPVKPKGGKAAKQTAKPSVKEEEEEQAEAGVQAEPQPETQVQPQSQRQRQRQPHQQQLPKQQSYELPNSGGMRCWGEPPGGWADDLPETGTSNTSIAPDNEGQNVDTSDQPSATANRTRPSAKRAQPKATKTKPKPKSKAKTPAVIETPELDETEEEYDFDTPYIPKDLRKELCQRLSWAGLSYPETWRPRVDSPFDAPPPPPENPPPADSILAVGLADDEVGYLRQLLRYWISEDKGSRTANKFFHRLHYTYKKSDSLPEALARHDRVLALTLERLSRVIPFELFLCRLDRGYEDIDIDPQQASPSYVIEDLVDFQSRTYAKFVPVDENDWTAKTTDHRKPKLLPGYCDAALVLVPRDTVADFLWETIEANGPPTAKYNVTQTPLRTLLENYKTLCSGSAEDHDRCWPIFNNLLRRACTWDNEKGLGFMPGEFVESILKTCISAKDWDLFTFAAGFTGFAFRKLPYDPQPFVKWARSEITEGRATFQDIQEGILAISFSHSLVNHRCSSITAFYQTTDETIPRDWARNAVVRIADFPDSQIIGQKDGSELVSAMKTCFGLGPDFTELATKVVKRNPTKLSFLLGFANELHESVTCSTEDATRELYLSLAEHILNELHIHKLHSRSAETARLREIVQLRSTNSKVEQSLQLLKPAIEGVDKADISRFISGLIAEKADILLMRLTMKLVGDAKRIPLRELTHLWVPFLWLLLDVLEKHQIPLSTPRYQNIFAAIMEVYLLREVGKAPKQIWQPVMRRISCDCGLCFRVNQFLSESCSFNAVRIHGSSTAFDHVRHYLTGLREGISCDFTVDAASGTITVTKRLKPDPTALKQWEAKKNKAKKQLFAKFDQAKLHAILGEEYLWFTEFQLLGNVLETEVHDEKELPPPPARPAPVLAKPIDHFIIGRPDLSTQSSQGYRQPVTAHQNPHQPFQQSTASSYQGPQPGQARPQPVGTYYSYQLPPPNQGHRAPANPWAYAGHSSQPVQYGQQFQSWPPQSTQSVVSISVGSDGFAGSIQMTNNINNHQTTTHIDGFSGSINLIQNNANNHQTTHIQGTLEHGRQLFFNEEATVIQRQFPSWQSGAINAELLRRWTTMSLSRVESYVSRATAAQNQAQTQPRPSLPAPFHSAPQPSGPSPSTEDDLKAGREYYFSTQIGSLRAKHPTYSHQLLLDTILQAWSSLPRTHREWFNKQALTQKQQQPQLPPLDNARAVGPSGTQSIPSVSSIAPPPPPSAVPEVPKNWVQPLPSFENRVAALREEAKVTLTTALAIKKPVVDRNGMVVVRTTTKFSNIPEKDYMESKARLDPYIDLAHLDPCRKQLDRGRTWWINKYKDALRPLMPGKSAQQVKQLLDFEWVTYLTMGDRLMTDDLARIQEVKVKEAREERILQQMIDQRANKRARTSYGAASGLVGLGKMMAVGPVVGASSGPGPSTVTPDVPPQSSAASPPVSGYEVFAKELEGRLRKTNPSASAASLKSVIQRRWEAMSDMHRAVYATMALDQAKSGPKGTIASTSTPATSASTSSASTSRKYDGFEYYLNTEGLSVRRKHPEYSYDQVVEATKRQWEALKSTERSNYSNKAFAAAQHPLDKGVFTWLEETFKRANKGKATVSSTPAAPSYNATSSSSSGGGQADGFGFWLKFEERKFREKNPRFTHEEAVAALRKTWEGMTITARGIYEDMAAKSNANANMTAKPTASQTPSSSSSAAAASRSGSPDAGRYDGFTWFLNSVGVDLKKQQPDIAYGDLRTKMYSQWGGLKATQRRHYEKIAGIVRQSDEGREMFHRLRAAYGLPPERDPLSPIPTSSSATATATTTTASSSTTSSNVSSTITREDWERKYDGWNFFLNCEGSIHGNEWTSYDSVVAKMKARWDRMSVVDRLPYEDSAKAVRMSDARRFVFNDLRITCGLPEEPDVPPPPAHNAPQVPTSLSATATATTASSSAPSSNVSSSITWEAWAKKYDGFSLYLNNEGCEVASKNTTYDSVVAMIKAKWEGISAEERLTWEKLAKSWRNNDLSRRNFNDLRDKFDLPSEPDIPPPPATTWEAWAEKYDGFNWFLNTRGYVLKQENRRLDYDLVVTIAEGWWERMTPEERREFEDKAEMMRTSLGGRRMFSKLRRLCGLPEEPDVPQPAKTVKPRTPFQSTWRGSGSKSATSLLSSSPTRPDPPSFSPAGRTLTEIQPNRMATSSSSAATATPGLSDKVAKIDITSAWAVKSSKLKIPPLSTPRYGSGSASASASGSGTASRGVKRKAEPDVIDLTLDD